MDIFNKLLISYQVKSTEKKGRFKTFSFNVDGESILIENSNFTQLPLNEQFSIVKKFVNKDRVRYRIKEYINIQWEEITPENFSCEKTS